MSSPELRASDADRDRAIAELREHTAAGRLTLEEFSERVDRAVTAKTLPELDEIGSDLPSALPVERARRRPKRFSAVAFGQMQRTGRWRLPRRALGLVLFGDLDLDLREAELSGQVASITVLVLFGNVDLYVPSASRSTWAGSRPSATVASGAGTCLLIPPRCCSGCGCSRCSGPPTSGVCRRAGPAAPSAR
jgi:Domain of unknown function (DUF1707)